MGKCSLCGAEGVTKATCPLNKPKPNHPNPEKHNVPNKSNSNDTLHNLLDNIKKNCTKESGNIDILKLNIENKPVKELKKTVKPTKKSAKKPIKNPGKNKVIDLDISVDQVLKYVISMGVVPAKKNQKIKNTSK